MITVDELLQTLDNREDDAPLLELLDAGEVRLRRIEFDDAGTTYELRFSARDYTVEIMVWWQCPYFGLKQLRKAVDLLYQGDAGAYPVDLEDVEDDARSY